MAKRNRTMKALLLVVVMLLAIQLSPLVFATEAEETKTTEPTTVETTVATEAEETEATTEPTTAPTTEPTIALTTEPTTAPTEDEQEDGNGDSSSDEATEPTTETEPTSVGDVEADYSGTLTIRVSGAEEEDYFLFSVTSEYSSVTVVVRGNGSVTVSGMQIGVTYTITQNTDWSWQYTTEESVKGCTLTAEDKVQEITFVQTAKEEICGAAGSAYVQEMLAYKEEA